VYTITATGSSPSAAVFAATDKGLYRSTGVAGGWQAVTIAGYGTASAPKPVYAVKQRGSFLFVGTNAGFRRSSDGGSSWQDVSTTSASANLRSEQRSVQIPQVVTVPTTATRTIQTTVGTGANARVVSSTQTITLSTTVTQWVTQTITYTIPQIASSTSAGALVGQAVYDIELVGTVLFAATAKGVYRSTNDGVTWSLVDVDNSANNNEVRGITVAGTTIVVNLWREGLWRSTNSGTSWTKLSIAGGGLTETAPCRAVYAHSSTASASTTTWLVGSVAGNLWRSTNSGSSWTRVYGAASTARAVGAVSTASAAQALGTSSANVSALAAVLQQSGVDAISGGMLTGTRGRQAPVLFATVAAGIVYSLNDGRDWTLTRTVRANTNAQALHYWNNRVYVGALTLNGGARRGGCTYLC
jgi:hypothetical protein